MSELTMENVESNEEINSTVQIAQEPSLYSPLDKLGFFLAFLAIFFTTGLMLIGAIGQAIIHLISMV